MTQRYTVAFAMCVALLLPVAARGDVGLTQVTPDNLSKLSDRLHIAGGVAKEDPNLREVSISGPTTNGVVVSSTLVLSNPKGEKLLRVPIRIEKLPLPEGKPEEWFLSCRIDRELALGATIDILLDVPAHNVGTVYRIEVKDFLPPAIELQPPSKDGG
jgi:hypothetical protein